MAEEIVEHHGHHELTASNHRMVYKLVLTGGPCGGKTTGQARLSTFFENLGWKVFRVPETATLLMSGGVKWPELSQEQAQQFQESLIKTMMQVEQTYFDLAELCTKNVLVICDRGVMDPSAYMDSDGWMKIISKYDWNNVDLRDSRYNQVIHMATAAKGAEEFYTTEEHAVRHEGPEQARQLDDNVAQAWVGHPYYDVVDNSTDFEGKLVRMIAAVSNRLGLDFSDRLSPNAKKRKFLVLEYPPDQRWPSFEEFDVVHDYLVSPHSKMQARIRKRGQNGIWTFTHTVRRPKIKGQRVELRKQISGRTYQMLLAQRDNAHYTIYKKRRCFLWKNKYFQMDIYKDPCHPRCHGLVILETYTSQDGALELPDFLKVECEVTDQTPYSMYNLSLKDYHPLEVQAGASATNGDKQFDYRQVYARELSGSDSGPSDTVTDNGGSS